MLLLDRLLLLEKIANLLVDVINLLLELIKLLLPDMWRLLLKENIRVLLMDMTKLSKEAESALLAANARNRGRIPSNISESAEEELAAAGMLGPHNGLTDRGRTARGQIARRLEDEAFGE